MRINNTQEHIDTLREYYRYDEKKKIFTIPVSYEKAEDVLDLDVIDPKNHPRFKKEALEGVKELLMSLPTGTKADIQLRIADYQGYDPDVLLKSFNDSIRLNQHRSRLEQKRSGLTATVLALIGAVILFVYLFGRINNWWGDDEEALSYNFITEILDIAAWVFLWEAVSVIFLYGDDYRSINAGLFIKINVIGFFNEDGSKQLSSELLMDEVRTSSVAKKWELIGKNMVLVSSVAMIIMGFFSIFNVIYTSIFVHMETPTEEVVFLVIVLVAAVVGVLFMLLGWGGIYHYLDKPKLSKFTFVATIVLGVLLLLYLISSIIGGEASDISSMALSITVYLIFAIGYFLSVFFTRKKEK